MNPILSFAASALPWNNFYILAGTAAATLVGLMVIAITFGAGLMTPETVTTARAFVDPPFTHFVQVLFTSALLLIPSMSPLVCGAFFALIAIGRFAALFKIARHMRIAHERAGDIENSDWVTAIVIPGICYVALLASAVAFIGKLSVAFDILAGVTVAILLSGVYGAWEMMIWMALSRTKQKSID